MSPPECNENRRRGVIWPVLLLVAAGLGLYRHVLPAPFIFDDAVAVVDNPSIRELGPAVLAAPANTPTAGRPVVNATLAANYAIGGLDVTGYHAFNIAIHICCGLLLYGVVLRTLERWGRTPFPAAGIGVCPLLALAAAMLWLVHPLQTQCVAYVTQRSESIMALFLLLTLYAAIRRWNVVAIVACALGMASKESMVTAPLLVVLYDWAYRDEPWRQVLARRRGLYAGLASTWIVLVALMATGPRAATIGFEHGVTAWQYALNQCVVVVGYVGQVFWPRGLLLDYGFPRAMTLAEAAPYALALAALLGLAVTLLVVRPRLGYPAAWFFVVLAPTSSIVPIATEVGADRRVYLALAGLAVLAVAGGWAAAGAVRRGLQLRPGRWPRLAGVAVLALTVAALSGASWRRAAMYREPVTLWEQSVEAVPRNHRARTNLAVALAVDGRYAEATLQMLHAVALEPDAAITGDNLAALLAAGASRDR